MALTLLEIYNHVTGQSWSIFDTDIESQEEFDSGVLSSIQKALHNLWHSHNFTFRLKRKTIIINKDKISYIKPTGKIKKSGVKLIDDNKITILKEIKEENIIDLSPQKPTGFFIISDKIILNRKPDKNYKLIIDYYTDKLGINKENIGVYNLKNIDDKLDIPEQFEEMFLNALTTKAMVNAIASSNSRNFQPYIKEFLENYRTLINQTTGIESDKTIEI